MDYHTTERVKKSLEDLQDALEDLGQSHSANPGDPSFSREAFLLLQGSAQEVVALWQSVPPSYFHGEVGDLIRRRLMLQNDRHDLWGPLQQLTSPLWSMEDVFLIPSGSSKLRSELLVRLPEDLPMVGDFDEKDFPERNGSPHRLLVAVALGDALAVQAIEQTPWIMNETSDNLEARLRGEGALIALAIRPLGIKSLAFARKQWETARSSGAWNVSDQALDDTSASVFKVLGSQSRAKSTEALLHRVIEMQGGGSREALELVRDIVWEAPPAIAARCWSAACASCPELLGLPPKPAAPFLRGVVADSDPFLVCLEQGRLLAGKKMFEQWDRPSFSSEDVDAQSRAWVQAFVALVDNKLPEQRIHFNEYVKQGLQPLRAWVDQEGAWPFNHLSTEGWRRLGRWSQQATGVLDDLLTFNASVHTDEEYRALRLQVKMVSTFLPQVSPPKPRF